MIWMAMLLAAASVPHGATAMKTVVCKPVEEAKGKSGQELAEAIERMAAQFSRANYVLTALLPGDPPIACFHGLSDGADRRGSGWRGDGRDHRAGLRL